MQTAADISLILTDSSSFGRFADLQKEISYSGFYQQVASELVKGLWVTQIFRNVGDRLVAAAEHAHALRRFDILEQVSRVLLNSSLPRPYEAIGRYYHALCINRVGRGDVNQAAQIIERVAESAPPRYRMRALLSLGAITYGKRDNQAALSLYREAVKVGSSSGLNDPSVTVQAARMFAVINSSEGNHRDGLAGLESLFPLARSMCTSQPLVYYDYLNSLAVELCEVGRIEEARNVSQIVVASPFAPAYPEWSETRAEIELRGWRASRSTVSVSQQTCDRESTSEPARLFRLPVPERDDSRAPADSSPAKKPARVFNLQEWKKKVPERRDRDTRLKELENLTTGDVITRIWGKLGDEKVRDEILCRVLLMLEDYDLEEPLGS